MDGITPKELKDLIDKGVKMGEGNTLDTNVRIPTYEVAGNEFVIGGPSTNMKQAEVQLKNVNAYITFGYDRESHLFSGFGGEGGNDCSTIDICAGVASALRRIDGKAYSQNNVVGKLMASDASRIYISQKTSVDHNFGLPRTDNHGSSKGRAAIAMKSDHIRIIGRTSIKLYAGSGAFQKIGLTGEKNAQAGTNMSAQVIELIAGDVNQLQPIVRGTQLVNCLRNIYEHIGKLYQRLLEESTDTLAFRAQSIVAFHPSTPVVTFPDPIAGIAASLGIPNTMFSVIDRVTSCLNSELDKAEFLGLGPSMLGGTGNMLISGAQPGLKKNTKDFAMKGDKYILSTSVFTT